MLSKKRSVRFVTGLNTRRGTKSVGASSKHIEADGIMPTRGDCLPIDELDEEEDSTPRQKHYLRTAKHGPEKATPTRPDDCVVPAGYALLPTWGPAAHAAPVPYQAKPSQALLVALKNGEAAFNFADKALLQAMLTPKVQCLLKLITRPGNVVIYQDVNGCFKQYYGAEDFPWELRDICSEVVTSSGMVVLSSDPGKYPCFYCPDFGEKTESHLDRGLLTIRHTYPDKHHAVCREYGCYSKNVQNLLGQYNVRNNGFKSSCYGLWTHESRSVTEQLVAFLVLCSNVVAHDG